MTQADLAAKVETSQPQISMYEAGDGTALSRKTLEKIADVLKIDLSKTEPEARLTGSPSEIALHYCPIDTCPSNIPYAVHDQLCFKPTAVRGRRDSGLHCAWCGELMMSSCPGEACDAEMSDGACCRDCGTVYVTSTVKIAGWGAGKWADEHRAKIREIREMGGEVAGAVGA
jgi:hypothetical protein